MEQIALAGGCFWHVEDILRQLPGVVQTRVGYTGGDVENPTYEMVCNSNTGHAEAVLVKYNPDQITAKELLKEFFRLHDPRQGNRQGWDIGPQYRSAIFYTTQDQLAAANKQIAQLNTSSRPWQRSVTTQLEPLGKFYEAEEYHQGYSCKRRGQDYPADGVVVNA